jgi:hypothetical protein
MAGQAPDALSTAEKAAWLAGRCGSTALFVTCGTVEGVGQT